MERYSYKNLWSLQVQRFVVRYPLVNIDITNWKITMLLMVKLTISMAMFPSYVSHYQRVYGWYIVDIWLISGWYMVDIWLIYGWYLVDIWMMKDTWSPYRCHKTPAAGCHLANKAMASWGKIVATRVTKDSGQTWLVKLLCRYIIYCNHIYIYIIYTDRSIYIYIHIGLNIWVNHPENRFGFSMKCLTSS